MGLLDLLFGGNKKKEKLLSMQQVVMENSPDRLVMTEKQLNEAARQQAQNDLRIINDCLSLLSKTIKPDVFFSRLELLQRQGGHLMLLEPYVEFTGASPAAAYHEIVTKKDEAIMVFLERYYAAVHEKAQGMKTAKGRANQYTKFYDSLQEYYPKMSKAHITYIEECAQNKYLEETSK